MFTFAVAVYNLVRLRTLRASLHEEARKTAGAVDGAPPTRAPGTFDLM